MVSCLRFYPVLCLVLIILPDGLCSAEKQVLATVDGFRAELFTDPTVRSSKLGAVWEEESLQQQFRLDWSQEMGAGLTLKGRTGSGFSRQERWEWGVMLSEEEAMTFTQRGALAWSPLPMTGIETYATHEARLLEGSTLSGEKSGYGTEIWFKPGKGFSLFTKAEQMELHGPSGILSEEERLGWAMEQQVNGAPVVLRAEQSLFHQSFLLPGSEDQTKAVVDGSARWNMAPGSSMKWGARTEDIQFEATGRQMESAGLYTEVEARPHEKAGLTARVDYLKEDWMKEVTGPEDLSLTLGSKVKLNNDFDAGFSARYKLDDFSTKNSTTDETSFSISVRGSF